ncbi:hypothetical protein GIB67_006182 [Kingdonia uniflora]|uniref:Response regulatory domain-containing protein n=1 Tax=Kingdonia uniflora TaxID=39325 RepID=A0A7J7LQ64_9MAGN|nr:hypothetical protein GIB67_006182 [Kingdonia uniflora]
MASTKTESSNRKLRVLIVDDCATIRLFNKMIVETTRRVVTQVVEDGKEAVDICKGGAVFDLILMDRNMPIMNGIQATKELREMGVTSMIVGVTDANTTSEKQEFMDAGLDDFYSKPLKLAAVQAFIQRIEKKL